MENLKGRYQKILEEVDRSIKRRGEGPHVTLIAVSKKQPIEAVEELYHLGQRDFGENYAQELVAKALEMKNRGYADVRWHFIGHLQSNKIKFIIPHVFWIHTVDSEKLAATISQACLRVGRTGALPVFIEVNIDGEGGKTGVAADSLKDLVAKITPFSEFSLQGLMCIPSREGDCRKSFQKLKKLEQSLRPISQGMLSMGMSADFSVAIEEGSTHIRVGTLLFGERKGLGL